jgi:hypothetical protein
VRRRSVWPPGSPPLDRRELLKLGSAAALAMLAGARAKSFASAAPARGADAMLAVADTRYSDSLSFAYSLQQGGAEVLPLGSDLAGLWFDAIQPRLQGSIRGLAGLTLASDLFALERLAESSGALTRYVGYHDWRCQPGSAHRLSSSIKLDEVAGALAGGEEHWAARLGEALASAAERAQGREERRLVINCPPAVDSPRFFVSWLMTWSA